MRVKKHPTAAFRTTKPMGAHGRVLNRGFAPKLTVAFADGTLTCKGTCFDLAIRLDEIQGPVIAKESITCKVMNEDFKLEGRFIGNKEIRLDAVDQKDNSWFWLTIFA